MDDRDPTRLLEVPSEGAIDVERLRAADVLVHNPSGARIPLIVIRSWSLTGEYIRDLARNLGPDHPIYSIGPPDFDDLFDYPQRPEEWVDFVESRLRHIPTPGPYCVGGWSFGGVLALELAERLLAKGEDVKLILMLDTRIPADHRRKKPIRSRNPIIRWIRRAANNVADFRRIEDRDARWRFARRKTFRREQRRRKRARGRKSALEQLREVGPPSSRENPGIREGKIVVTSKGERMSFLQRTVQLCYVKYERRKTSIPTAILWTEESRARQYDDPALGWSPQLEGPHRCIGIPGSHWTMFEPPNELRVAEVVRDLLDDVAAGSFASKSEPTARDL